MRSRSWYAPMRMSDGSVELVIVPGPGAVPVRRTLAKMVTTIGADARADVRLTTVARHWAVVKRRGDRLEVRLLESGDAHVLAPGARLEVDGTSDA